jgi:hypothetical protein
MSKTIQIDKSLLIKMRSLSFKEINQNIIDFQLQPECLSDSFASRKPVLYKLASGSLDFPRLLRSEFKQRSYDFGFDMDLDSQLIDFVFP